MIKLRTTVRFEAKEILMILADISTRGNEC